MCVLVFVAHVHDMLVVLTSVFGIVSLVLAPMAAAVAYDYCVNSNHINALIVISSISV